MKYCLSIRKKNLPPYMITGFNKVSGFEHLNATSLQDIVEFTHNFENQIQLIYFLMENNLVPVNYFNGDFGIDYFKRKSDTNGKTLQYGISFQDDVKFYDTEFLQSYFANHLKEEEFAKSFIQKYYKQLRKVPLFQEDLENIKLHYNKKNPYYERVKNSAYSFVYYYTMVKNDAEYKLNFTRLRDLAMFTINYERNLQLEIDLPEYNLNTLNNMINHYESFLRNKYLSEEERTAYERQVEKIKEQINLTEMCLKRSKKA